LEVLTIIALLDVPVYMFNCILNTYVILVLIWC